MEWIGAYEFAKEAGWDWYRLAEIVLIFASVVIVVVQVLKGVKHTIAAQRENHRQEYMTRMYSQICDLIDEAVSADIDSTGYIQNMMLMLAVQQDDQNQSLTHRAVEFHKLHSHFSQSVLKLFTFIESNEIVSPSFRVFQMALGSALHNFSEKAYLDLYRKQLAFLPMDILDNQGKTVIANKLPLTKDQYKEIEILANTYIDRCGSFGSIFFDLRVQMQKDLLGSIFENKVEIRKPISSDLVVIAIENENDVRRLVDHYENDTDWGKHKKALDKALH